MIKKIKSNVINNFLNRILFEDGYQEDEQAPSLNSENPVGTSGNETTIPAELPIGSSQEMAVQLSIQTPPVDDPDYVPVNSVDLSHAADAIAKMVPDEQVQWYYNELHRLLDTAIEKETNPESEPVEEEEETIDKVDIAVQKEVYSVKLKDVISFLIEHTGKDILESKPEYGYDSDDPELGERPEIDWMGDEGELPPNPQPEETTDSDGTSLDVLASKFGYSGPSGVRQDLERILARVGFTAENLNDKDLASLQAFAVKEFINQMYTMDLIEKDDLDDMLKSPGAVMGLDSFRFFFVSGFMLPAYKKIVRAARKRVEAEIEKINVPQKTKQTIVNQAFGDTPRSSKKLRAKLLKDATAEGMDPVEMEAVANEVQSAFPKLQNIAQVEGDMVTGAIDVWQNSGNAKKNKIMQQALSSTASFQAEK